MRVNFGSGTDLLPDSIKPLHEKNVAYHQCGFLEFTIPQEMLNNLVRKKIENYMSIAISLRGRLIDKIFSFIHRGNGAVFEADGKYEY